MQTAKDKIILIVKEYKKSFHEEMAAFSNSLSRNIKNNLDKFGSVKRGNDIFERKIVEFPENLFIMLNSGLTQDELSWLLPVKDPKCEGIKWFARMFPEFRASEKL